MPSVSVVIPCYNYAHYLPDAIESVLAQRDVPAEILVVDDGSTDATPDVACRYQPHVQYIRQENRGLSAARNTGIRHAKGDLIAFLDADDCWLPAFLLTLVPMLEADPSLGAVYGGSQFVDEHRQPLFQKTTRVVPSNQIYDALLGGQFFPPHCVLVRRSCFEQVGYFDEGLRACEDWDMWLRISAQYPMGGTSKIVTHYRMHGNNMTRDLTRMYESLCAVARKHCGPESGDAATWPIRKQRAFAGVYVWRALAHYRRGEPALASRYVSKALTTSPQLAGDLDFFYALGCADQPVGGMGDLAHLNLRQNAGRLQEALDATFSDPEVPARLAYRRELAYGTAGFAIGLLAYGCGQPGDARHWLAEALRYRPSLMLRRMWLATFARSLLGRRPVRLLKKLAQG